MKHVRLLFVLLFLGLASERLSSVSPEKIIAYEVDLQTAEVAMYWKDDRGQLLRSLKALKGYVESNNKKLLMAMNGGMYKGNLSPQGLFIQGGKEITPLDTGSGSGNFYLKPNGIFYLTRDKKAVVCRTEKFRMDSSILFATQSGPMLLIDGTIHKAFAKGSDNVNIRNGVGLLPDGKVLFAISRNEINLYDFALFFKERGCKNALYLDGYVSRAYIPEKNWVQLDGDFGVMIGVVK